MPQPYGPETMRLQFLRERDGVEGAIRFAETTLKSYRKAVLCSLKRGVRNPHYASLPEYRRGFIESYMGLKAFLSVYSAAATPGCASLGTPPRAT